MEAVFDDGSRLVTVVDPIGGGHLGLDAPGALIPGVHRDDEGIHVGEATRSDDIVTVLVVNESVVPISVSSHFHFFEVNPRLRFDRAAAYGRRLDVPAGSTVAFAPGEPVEVALVPWVGRGSWSASLDSSTARWMPRAPGNGLWRRRAPAGSPTPATPRSRAPRGMRRVRAHQGPRPALRDAVPALVRDLAERPDRAHEGVQP